ncbi:MAG: hypothetical protein K0Q72_1594 [Armatimonadetes bacterium]|jgi:hypothetical protein|nr:hypothetical protein [Armatimonadota bacterium]
MHWASTPIDPRQDATRTIELSMAAFLELFPELEEDVRYVALTVHNPNP